MLRHIVPDFDTEAFADELEAGGDAGADLLVYELDEGLEGL